MEAWTYVATSREDSLRQNTVDDGGGVSCFREHGLLKRCECDRVARTGSGAAPAPALALSDAWERLKRREPA